MLKVGRIFFSILMSAYTANASVGVTDTEILIGQSLDLSTSLKARSRSQLAGENLLIDKVNKNGGIFGRKIRMVTYDDQYDPKRTSELSEKLINEDHVFALFGLTGTPTVKAVLPVLEKSDVPLLGPNTGANFLRTPPIRNVFNVKPGFQSEADTIIDFFLARSHKEIALFYQDDTFGGDGRASVAKSLIRHDLKTVAVGSYRRGTTDVSEGYDQIKKVSPKAVILWGTADASAAFIKKAASDKWQPVFMVPSTVMGTEFFGYISGLKATVFGLSTMRPPQGSKLELAQEYLEDAKNSGFEADPNAYSGYLNAKVLVEALRAAGKDLTRDSFRGALEAKMNGMSIGGLNCEFSKTNHQAFSKMYVGQIVNSKFELLP